MWNSYSEELQEEPLPSVAPQPAPTWQIRIPNSRQIQLSSGGRKLRIWNTFKQLQEHKKDKGLAQEWCERILHMQLSWLSFFTPFKPPILPSQKATAMHKTCNEDKSWHKIWQIVMV